MQTSTEGHGAWRAVTDRTVTPVVMEPGLVVVVLEGSCASRDPPSSTVTFSPAGSDTTDLVTVIFQPEATSHASAFRVQTTG